jgi:hypothetical protein
VKRRKRDEEDEEEEEGVEFNSEMMILSFEISVFERLSINCNIINLNGVK